MKMISRLCLFSTLILVLLTACTGQQGTPTAAGTTVPTDVTSYPPPVGTEETVTAFPGGTEDVTATTDVTATLPAGADATQTPEIPVTGDQVLLECQFCIDGAAHAMLVLPDTATFETVGDTASLSTPGPDFGCNTVDTYNGRQIVICRGEENTSLNLNICTDGTNCTQLLVELESCPDTDTTPDQPGLTNTPRPEDPTSTPGIGVPTATPGVIDTDTPGVLPTNSPNASVATASP